MNDFQKIRVFYQKTGRAKFISHLDVNRLMQRVLKRTGLPVWYTEGFNPHMYLTFALPLSLGYESLFECMDFRLTKELPFEIVTERLNASLPEGFFVTNAAVPIHKASDISAADYHITVKASCGANQITSAFQTFFSTDSIQVIKKTKRGEQMINIRPDVQLVQIETKGEAAVFSMRFPAGTEKNYNPSLLFDTFYLQSAITPSHSNVLRTCVYCADGSVFA